MNADFIRLSAVVVVMISTASGYAQSDGNNSTGGIVSGLTPSLPGGGSGSTSNNSGTGSRSGSKTGVGVSEFRINTDNVQNPTAGFVGANATETFVGGVRQAANQQEMTRQFQQFQSSQITESESQQTGTSRSVRTTTKIGFSFPTASAAQRSGQLADVNTVSMSRFAFSRPELAGVDVNLSSEGVAVLAGTSPSTEASRLAANLIRLQPGVRKVINQIVVLR